MALKDGKHFNTNELNLQQIENLNELKKIGEIQSVFTNSNNNENSEIISFVSEKFEFNY